MANIVITVMFATMLLGGCVTKKMALVAEKEARKAVAERVDKKMKDHRKDFKKVTCDNALETYDKLVEEVKKMILK